MCTEELKNQLVAVVVEDEGVMMGEDDIMTDGYEDEDEEAVGDDMVMEMETSNREQSP